MILKTIKDQHEKSEGKCGLTMIQLAEQTGKTYSAIKTAVAKLNKSGDVNIRPGINSKLLFYGRRN